LSAAIEAGGEVYNNNILFCDEKIVPGWAEKGWKTKKYNEKFVDDYNVGLSPLMTAMIPTKLPGNHGIHTCPMNLCRIFKKVNTLSGRDRARS
jgi:hypothetical protein